MPYTPCTGLEGCRGGNVTVGSGTVALSAYRDCPAFAVPPRTGHDDLLLRVRRFLGCVNGRPHGERLS